MSRRAAAIAAAAACLAALSGCEASAPGAGGGLVGELVSTVVALVAVCALAYVAILLMKRFQVTGPGAGAAHDLRFLRALPLGPRERVVAIEWKGETLLLGVTAGGISLLDRRPTPPGQEPPTEAAPAEPAIGTDPS